jgi:formamidopyrimidine-DNA glycosylase
MPELPEVETVVRSLQALVTGGRIRSAELNFRSVFKNRRAGDFALLEGAEIVSIGRAGKFILIELRQRGGDAEAQFGNLQKKRASSRSRSATGDGKMLLLVHLGMSGKLLVSDPAEPRERHTHAILTLEDGREIRFVDPRRFGKLAISTHPDAIERQRRLGVAAGAEPLLVDSMNFARIFSGRTAPIKNALLNQKLLRGVGNIYADESLFRAGIHPCAHRISAQRLERLRLAVRRVLEEAIAAGGSSISDYVDSSGQRGWFQTLHRVYGREGEPCVQCTTPIRRKVLAGRSAHFCPRCQRR